MTDIKATDYVKTVTSDIAVPIADLNNGAYEMALYIGPNEFRK